MATTKPGGSVGAEDQAAASAARLGIAVGLAQAASSRAAADNGQRRYLNPDLSTLDYYNRGLALAEDPDMPLLERAKFLAIFSSLLDEFFEIRVAGLKDQLAAGLSGTDPAGLNPSDQLKAIRAEVDGLLERRARAFLDVLVPELAEHGIGLSRLDDLDD